VTAALSLLLCILISAASAGPSARAGVLVYASVRAAGPGAGVDVDVVSDLFSVRLDSTGFRRLTRTTAWESAPAWSPNRRHIAYSRGDPLCHASTCEWGPTSTNIWVMAANGASPRPLTRHDEEGYYLDEWPMWSPDSRRIAFARNDNLDGSDPTNGIYVVGVDGGGLARISRAEVSALAWSPDGSKIAYVHQSHRYIGLLDVGTGRSRRLQAPGISWPSSVSWSPRGRFLAIAAAGALFIAPASGGAARQVVAARGLGEVSWSPDGCCLLFSAMPRGARWERTDLYVVSVRGGRPRRLTRSRHADFDPAWRP
jgi:Tol biopolymer transport system component